MTAAFAALLLLAPRTWGEPSLMCSISSNEVAESSGVAASRVQSGTFYTHNDSGDKARFFRFDKAGKVTGEFSLKGVKAIDWEDMASATVNGRPWLYLADCGDNLRKRTSITIYRVPEPTGAGGEISQFDTYAITYPDKARDCEAVMIHPSTGDIWLVTKARDRETVAYRLRAPQKSGSYKLELMAKLQVATGGLGGDWVTGGDISLDGRHVVIRTYSGALEYAAPAKFEDWVKAEPVLVKTALETQGEAVGYSRDGSMLITTSEGKPCRVSVMALRK